MLRNRKGQSTAEYAIIIGVIVAALIGMQTYIKRGLQARYHDGIQFLNTETSVLGVTSQYEPYYLESSYDTNRDRTSDDDVQARGLTTRTLTTEKITRAKDGFEQSLAPTVGVD